MNNNNSLTIIQEMLKELTTNIYKVYKQSEVINAFISGTKAAEQTLKEQEQAKLYIED